MRKIIALPAQILDENHRLYLGGKPMKKISVLLLVVVLLFAFTGCTDENNFPGYLNKSYFQKRDEATMELINRGFDVKSIEKKINLVSNTIDKNREFEIIFLIETSTGEISEFVYQAHLLHMNKDEYRRLFAAELTLAILDYLGEDSGDIVSTIITWEGNEKLFKDRLYYSICDFDCDGDWDYIASDDSWYDARIGFVVSSDIDDSYDEPTRLINEHYRLSLKTYYSEIELQKFDGFPKNPTFIDIEDCL